MQTITLHGVPPADVDQVAADFESEGFTVTRQRQTDGNDTLVATKGGQGQSRGGPGSVLANSSADSGTVVIHNVPADQVGQVVTDLTSEGFSVSVEPEPDGEFTVMGRRLSRSMASAQGAVAKAAVRPRRKKR